MPGVGGLGGREGGPRGEQRSLAALNDGGFEGCFLLPRDALSPTAALGG